MHPVLAWVGWHVMPALASVHAMRERIGFAVAGGGLAHLTTLIPFENSTPMAARMMPVPSIATFDAIAASIIPPIRHAAKASHRAGLQRIVYGGVRQSRSVRQFFIVVLNLLARLAGSVAAFALHLLGVA
jgi:hypothetical protein